MSAHVNEQVACKHCSSLAVIKYGTPRRKSGEVRQKYQCFICRRTFVIGDRRYIQDVDKRKAVVIREYTDGKSLRGAARSANVSLPTAQKWIKEVSNELPDVSETYEEYTKDEDPELHKRYVIDEIWHFLEHKKSKLLCIKIYNQTNKKLVGYELGGRDEETVLKLYHKIRKSANTTFYCDDWSTFRKVFNENNKKYRVGKDKTYPIEQHNSNTRHYLGRFHRRTKIVSRSMQMVDISIKLMTIRVLPNSRLVVLESLKQHAPKGR